MRLIFSALLFAAMALSQSTSGTIVGTVLDSTGASVAGAKVQVKNEGTGAVVNITTSETGAYVAPSLPPAIYTVRVEMPGFRAAESLHVQVPVNATVRNDVRLQAGDLAQTVDVTATAPVINSESASVSTIVDTHAVATLPVNGRTIDRFLLIAPGNTSDSSSNPKLGGSLHWGGNFFTIDGVAVNDTGNGGASYSYQTNLTTLPSIDTIQEFKIEFNNVKAENEGSAAVSIITKSGTNLFHGSLFEFNRNAALAAKSFFATSLPKPPFVRNEFGATVGGPIIKNKTFFFASYEGLRQRSATTNTLRYATAAQRNGDYTGLPVINDPLTGSPFPNNVIPTARLDSRSLALLKYVPLPNLATTANNFVTNVGNVIDVNRYTARVDHNFNPKHIISGILTYSKGSPYFVYNGGNNNYGNFADGGYITKSAAFNHNWTVTPTSLNELRVAYFSHASIRIGQNTDFNPQSLFPSLYGPLPLGGLPTATFNGAYNNIGDSGGSDRAPEITRQITDNFSFIRGKHTFKTGLDFANSSIATNPSAGAAQFGSFAFTGRFSGDPMADFLLGYPNTATRGTPGLVNKLYYTRWGAYVQDDYRVSNKLTLNLGVRYTLQTQPQERDNSWANFDFGTGQFVIRSQDGQLPRLALPRLLSAYPYTTSEKVGWGSDVLQSDHNNFAPRIGFAYRPFAGNRTVVRGGYGIFYNIIPVFIGIRQISLSNSPFQLSETFSATAGATPSLTLANPFPGGGTISANPNITAVNRQITNTLAQQWNFTIEHEIIQNLGLRISYIGNKATNVPWYTYERNAPIQQGPGTLQSLRPYQPWGSISTLDTNGNSITHQLQFEATRRYKSGLYLQGSFTWNKSLDNVPIAASVQNPYAAYLDRGNSESVRGRVGYLSATYDLPFGKGRKYLTSGVANVVLGGWQLATITQLRSGTPYSVTFSSNQPGWIANRANVVSSDFYPSNQSIAGWFNPSAFSVPPVYTYGNSARNMLWGPGQVIIDMSVLKDIAIYERVKLQFRAEAFNMPNHPSFSNPAANISVPTTVGKITNTSVASRAIQFGLKLLF
jgi:hypothetical protein